MTACPLASCVTDHGHGYKSHESAREPIRTDAGASFTAYAHQSPSGHDKHVSVDAHTPDGTYHGPLWLDDAEDAAHLAGIVEALADATPADHKALAEQILNAAEALAKGSTS